MSYRCSSFDTTLTKVFIGNLAWNTTSESLHKHFSVYGDIHEAVVIDDRLSGKSRGYGFVTFERPECAADATADSSPSIDMRKTNCIMAAKGAKKRYNGHRSFRRTNMMDIVPYQPELAPYTQNDFDMHPALSFPPPPHYINEAYSAGYSFFAPPFHSPVYYMPDAMQTAGYCSTQPPMHCSSQQYPLSMPLYPSLVPAPQVQNFMIGNNNAIIFSADKDTTIQKEGVLSRYAVSEHNVSKSEGDKQNGATDMEVSIEVVEEARKSAHIRFEKRKVFSKMSADAPIYQPMSIRQSIMNDSNVKSSKNNNHQIESDKKKQAAVRQSCEDRVVHNLDIEGGCNSSGCSSTSNIRPDNLMTRKEAGDNAGNINSLTERVY